ncbi:hypothetical protein DENSPDRAFT_145475 [Dentipellis sp. KUC8613]|nr:hypothetical protein DENSPDRAFT_145475 [Dentipellis sp. KUC8613]
MRLLCGVECGGRFLAFYVPKARTSPSIFMDVWDYQVSSVHLETRTSATTLPRWRWRVALSHPGDLCHRAVNVPARVVDEWRALCFCLPWLAHHQGVLSVARGDPNHWSSRGTLDRLTFVNVPCGSVDDLPSVEGVTFEYACSHESFHTQSRKQTPIPSPFLSHSSQLRSYRWRKQAAPLRPLVCPTQRVYHVQTHARRLRFPCYDSRTSSIGAMGW